MERKLGEGALAAAWRQGHKEVGQMLKAFPDSIMVEEPGQMNNPTSHGISQQSGYVQPVSSKDERYSIVEQQRADVAQTPQRQEPEIEMER